MIVFISSIFLMCLICLAIHKLTGRLGIGLSAIALISCVFSALAINFFMIATVSFLTTSYFIQLGLMVFFAATATTLGNQLLFKRLSVANAIGDEASKELLLPVEPEPIINIEAEATLGEEIIPESIVEKAITEPMVEVATEKAPMEDESVATTKDAEAEISSLEPIDEDATVNEEPIVEEAPATVELESIAEETADTEPEKEPVTETVTTIETKKPEDNTKPTEPDTSIIEETATEVTDEATEIIEPEPVLEPSTDKEPEPIILPSLNTMDEFLDYAFEANNKGLTQIALKAYNMALDKYSQDPYAPFIVIEIANIYKNQGEYQEAIKIYQRALEIPALKDITSLQEQFKSSIAYLENTYKVLNTHNNIVPFGQISKELLLEIESAYTNKDS